MKPNTSSSSNNNQRASSNTTTTATTTPKSGSDHHHHDDDAHKYSLSFDNVIKGPLKLKGRTGTIGGITKQHKTNNNNSNQKAIVVEKTEAEQKYETKSMERKKKLIKERAQKSYREKINEFNDRISKLTEYNDIPKV